MFRVAILSLAVLLLPFHPAWAETFLLMGEQRGCHYCERWHDEIGHIYPKTDEGATAPLRQFNIHKGPPEGVTLTRSVRFTPTFILIEDGQERGRIEGYPGEDFFWGLLGKLLDRADIKIVTSG